MSRIDRARLDAATFPMLLSIPTRFDDLDVQGHVNNVAALAILQEGRVLLNRGVRLGDHIETLRVLVASITVDYAGELHHPDPVELGTGVVAIGRTSVTIGQRAAQGGTGRLYAETVLVVADASGPTPLPAVIRDAYAARMI